MSHFPINEPEQSHPEISDNLRRIVPDDMSPVGLVAGLVASDVVARGLRGHGRGRPCTVGLIE